MASPGWCADALSIAWGTGCTTGGHGALLPHTPAPKPAARGYSPLWAPRFVSQNEIALQSRHEIGSFGGVGRFSPLDNQRGGGAGFVCSVWTGAEMAKAEPTATQISKGSGGLQAGADGVHAKKVQAREIGLPWAVCCDNIGRR